MQETWFTNSLETTRTWREKMNKNIGIICLTVIVITLIIAAIYLVMHDRNDIAGTCGFVALIGGLTIVEKVEK